MVTFSMRKIKFTKTQNEDIEEALGMEGLRNLPRKKLTALLMICKGLTQAKVRKALCAEAGTGRVLVMPRDRVP